MSEIRPSEVNLAVVAPQKTPVGETGGAEVFTGAIANALAEQGFPVHVYGQENPTFKFVDGVTYVPTSPTAEAIMANDNVGIRKAVNETGIAAPFRLAMDIAASPEGQQWAIIDNDTTTAPLTPLLRCPHIFVQHSRMTPHTYRIYDHVKANGGKIVAIADYQREEVAARFGPLHDVTIKNGINVRGSNDLRPRTHQRGEPIHIGTLARIELTDMKGIKLAARAVNGLRQRHDAFLTIAGPMADRATYEAILEPILDEHVTYVGAKRGPEKHAYLAGVHVGAALSNPGGWDDKAKRFTSCSAEGNSLTLHEMMHAGTVPVSTDSGGAEPLTDAGLHDFIVPLHVIPKKGMDAFIDLAAQKMLEAAYYPGEISDLRSRVRTMEDVGRDYAAYILGLLNVK